MGLVVLGEGEAGVQVILEQRSLVSLDVSKKSLVNGGLEITSFLGYFLLLGSLGEELGSVSFLLNLASRERLISDLGDISALNVNLGTGSDCVDLVHTLERHTVDLVGSSDKQETGLQLLQEHNSLSSESAGKQNQNGTGLDALAELGSLGLLSSWLPLLILGWVPFELLDHCTLFV